MASIATASSARWVHTDPLSALCYMPDDIPINEVTIGPDHKTVIVLDHSPDFATSSNFKIDVPLKDSTTGQMRVVNQVEKTLWTCAVESAFEFHRIVDEIYPDGVRLMRFVISDFVGRFLTPNWGMQLISLDQLLKSFASCGVPDAKADLSSCSIINGISMAVEAISELTELQKKLSDLNAGFKCFGRYSKQRGESSTRQNDDDTQLENRENLCDVVDDRKKKDSRSRKFGDRVKKLSLKMKLARKEMHSLTVESGIKKTLPNMGSIVVFTSLKSDEDIAMLTKHITEDIISRNKIVKALDGDKNFAPISHVQVYFIIIYPVTDGNKDKTYLPTAKSLTKLNEYVSCSVVCAEAGPSLRPILHGVILKHFDLASTTVTSIPMKEEAQQGQSVNYDVEVFHPRRSHHLLQQYDLIGPSSKLRTTVSPGDYETVKLAWTTPSAKNRWNQFPRCISALPVSPASVNGRPSVCLTSFLLSGRNVMLEVLKQNIHLPREVTPNVNQKLISHLLMCHAGRIYMHTVHIGNHPVLDDRKFLASAVLPKPNALLRIADFATFMKETRLFIPQEPDVLSSSADDESSYNEQARKQLLRLTRYWPLKLNEAFIYNIPKKFDPLLTLIRRSELSTSDVSKCRECIYALMAYKDSKEPLTAKSVDCVKFKNPLSRDEQFRYACEELLNHLHNYVNHSERHLEISGLDRATHLSVQDVSIRVTQPHSCSSSVSTFRSQSPVDAVQPKSRSMSPVVKKPRKAIHMWGPNEKLNLYDFYLERYQKEHLSKWKDFVGRVKAGNKPAILYPNLDLSKAPNKGDVESV
uniref:Protein asunder n=1 Tax=Setaria digitata TaxID=48799 RepID=A0A915PXW4_9BILA